MVKVISIIFCFIYMSYLVSETLTSDLNLGVNQGLSVAESWYKLEQPQGLFCYLGTAKN